MKDKYTESKHIKISDNESRYPGINQNFLDFTYVNLSNSSGMLNKYSLWFSPQSFRIKQKHNSRS